MTTKRRKRIGKGIYRDKYGLSATVKVGTGDRGIQREKRFPFDTPLKDIKAWQGAMRSELRRAAGPTGELVARHAARPTPRSIWRK